MSKRTIAPFHLALLVLLVAGFLQAYIGSGLGAGTAGVILGLVGSILIAVFAFFWYPIKRTFIKRTASAGESEADEGDAKDGLEVAEEQK